MVQEGKKSKNVLDLFNGRLNFMKDILEGSIDSQNKNKEKK